MQFLLDIEDRLLKEMKEFSHKETANEMSAQDLDNLKDMSDTLLNITTYIAMKNSGYGKEEYMDGTSNMARAGMRGRMGMSNMGGYRGRSYHGGDDWEKEMYYNNMRPNQNMY